MLSYISFALFINVLPILWKSMSMDTPTIATPFILVLFEDFLVRCCTGILLPEYEMGVFVDFVVDTFVLLSYLLV